MKAEGFHDVLGSRFEDDGSILDSPESRALSQEHSNSRIAIIGSAGVGKTTLLDALCAQGDCRVVASPLLAMTAGYTKIPEVVRVLCAERGYKSPYDIPEAEIHKFREDVLDRQIELEEGAGSFIVDRSTIDAWVYYMRWSWNSTDVEDAERFYQKAYSQAQKYDRLIYLPIAFELQDDGFRWNNPIYQKQIDRLLISTVKDWGLEGKLVELKSDVLDDRVNQISSCF